MNNKLITSVRIWLVIYPSITTFLYFLGPALSVFPLYIRTLILTVVLVPWVVFGGLPLLGLLTRTLRGLTGNNAKHTVKESQAS